MEFQATAMYNIALDDGGMPLGFSGWQTQHPMFAEITLPVEADSYEAAAERLWMRLNLDDRPNALSNRSMSVGDVVVITGPDYEDQRAFAIEMAGLREIDVEAITVATDNEIEAVYEAWGTPAYQR